MMQETNESKNEEMGINMTMRNEMMVMKMIAMDAAQVEK